MKILKASAATRPRWHAHMACRSSGALRVKKMRICKLCVRACGRLGIPKQDPIPRSMFVVPSTFDEVHAARHTRTDAQAHNTRRETAHDLIDSTSSVNSRVPPAGIPHSGKPPSPSAMHITWDSSEGCCQTRKREMTSHRGQMICTLTAFLGRNDEQSLFADSHAQEALVPCGVRCAPQKAI